MQCSTECKLLKYVLYVHAEGIKLEKIGVVVDVTPRIESWTGMAG
jgi:hypothetical protein